MNLLDPALLIAGIASTAILFGMAAYFTRAGARRIAGALIASLPIIPMVMLYDRFAAQSGWWYYPFVTKGDAPFAWYVAAALGYGAALGLVGWRVIRRWDAGGFIAFILIFALFGVTRDYIYSVTTGVIHFGPGLIPLLADLFSYGSGAVVVQLLMGWIAGPARSDTLARRKKKN